MNKFSKLICRSILLVTLISCGLNKKNAYQIENTFVILEYNTLSGTFSITNKQDPKANIDAAVFTANQYISNRKGAMNHVEITTTNSAQELLVTNTLRGEPTLLYKAVLQKNEAYLELTVGINNTTIQNIRLMNFSVLKGQIFSEVTDKKDIRILDGNAGGGQTKVTDTTNFTCYNNVLMTFKSKEKRYSLVAGGLSYQDFEKKIKIKNHKTLEVYADDPVGKLVVAGETYWATNDRFYLDIVSSDPFKSLETYGLSLRKAQGIELNQYTFPTVCMWYVNFDKYGGQTGINDSPGAVEEMRRIKESGFLNYSGTAAVRLVPDNYGYNNQQSWWDDEHYSTLGNPSPGGIKGAHLKAPYETLKKFGEAISSLGGLPLLYFQSNWRSEDYAAQYPDQMLFNKSYARRDDPNSTEVIIPKRHESSWKPCEDRNREYYGQDFTDINFLTHMKEVYSGMGKSKIAGLMYDYPWSGWADKGGMDDTAITATAAYRKMFQLAKSGLGKISWLHERNIEHPSDAAIGLVESQRTMWDNDKLTPESVAKSGLRWYKNRVIVSYDADAKNLLTEDKDELRKILTMSYVTTGRLLLGVSFGAMSKETIHDLSRIYPFHSDPKSARPIDAFVREVPTIYDFPVNNDWHQLTLFNPDDKNEKNFNISLSGELAEGCLGLNPKNEYYVYDFWNDTFLGKLKGSGELKQTLRADEARMLSIRKVEFYPQIISVNRHVMQGFESLLKTPKWKKNRLIGSSKVVINDPYTMTIALNGRHLRDCEVNMKGITCLIDNTLEKTGIAKVTIISPQNAEISWALNFEMK